MPAEVFFAEICLVYTTNRGDLLQMEIVGSITNWSYNQSEQLVTGRTTDRATA